MALAKAKEDLESKIVVVREAALDTIKLLAGQVGKLRDLLVFIGKEHYYYYYY